MAIEMPLWMDPNPTTGVAPEYSARQDRGIIARLFTEGVEDVQGGNLLVAQRAAGANMTVEVAAGAAYVAGDDVARQGTYRIVVTSTESVDIAAAPASNSRIDLVVMRVFDATAIGGTEHRARIYPITGVAAASPVAPAVPNTAIPLAQVLVAAGTTSITTSSITDRRAQAGANTLKVGTQPQSMTQAQRDALTGGELYDGRFILNTTSARLEIYLNGSWRAVGGCQVDVFTASGMWTKPAGARSVIATAIGAGGSGGSFQGAATSTQTSTGGAGGGWNQRMLIADGLPSTVSVSVGAPGASVSGSTFGNDGDSSSFGGYVVAGGGKSGGYNASSVSYGGASGYPCPDSTPPGSATPGVALRHPGAGGMATPGTTQGSGASPHGGGAGGSALASSSVANGGASISGSGGVGGGSYDANNSILRGGGVAPTTSTVNGATVTGTAGPNRSGSGSGSHGGGAAILAGSATSGSVTGGAGGIPGGGGGAGHGQNTGGNSNIITAASGPGARGEVVVVTIF